jgi:hypothetical protein
MKMDGRFMIGGKDKRRTATASKPGIDAIRG